MKMMTKRLLCRLLVVAMVLSMLPATSFGAAATEAPGQQAMADGAVVIQSAKALGEFPAPAEGQTTVTKVCPVCKTEQAWTALVSGATTANLTGHYYLAEDLTTGVSVLSGKRTLCLNLNGKNITAGPEALSFANSTMHVLDTVGTSIVTGNNGAAIYLNGAKAGGTANIYGGTYTKSGSTTTSVVSIGGNGGTVNFYGGTMDAR